VNDKQQSCHNNLDTSVLYRNLAGDVQDAAHPGRSFNEKAVVWIRANSSTVARRCPYKRDDFKVKATLLECQSFPKCFRRT
jgi:hypothetical protein